MSLWGSKEKLQNTQNFWPQNAEGVRLCRGQGWREPAGIREAGRLCKGQVTVAAERRKKKKIVKI